MNIQQAKSIALETLLQRLGFSPVQVRKKGREIWYRSPFREEKTPSFKITVPFNSWYDFGLGQGGNILDFIMLYENQDLSGALTKLDDFFTQEKEIRHVRPTKSSIQAVQSKNTAITLLKNCSLEHEALCEYLTNRKISVELARHYLQQVLFSVNKKTYFALGFENDQGGWELRNKYFQGSTSPKSITVLRGEEPDTYLRVFEGFMDFLSYLTIKKDTHFQGTVLVLNSLALFSKLEEHLVDSTYKAVIAFFDNDDAGQEAYNRLEKTTSLPLYDRSSFYQGYKDLNAYLVSRK